MPDALTALITALASVAVALITAGVWGNRKKKQQATEEMDPMLAEIFQRWHNCEQRLRQIIKLPVETGPTISSSEEPSSLPEQ